MKTARRLVTVLAAAVTLVVPSVALAESAQAATAHLCNTDLVKTVTGKGNVGLPYYKASSGSTLDCYMQLGSTGAGVKELQYDLIFCYDQDIDPDGSFGPATQTALRSAQRAAKIAIDGSYGPETRTHILWDFAGASTVHCQTL